MKKTPLFILIFLCPVFLFSCKSAPREKKDKLTDLITIRTLGLAYLEEFKLEEAEEQFLRFIELAPEEKLGYANLGLTYLRMGKYEEAEKQLFKAIDIDPSDPDIRLILATVYQMKDNPASAVSQLKEALTHSPDHIKTLFNLTEILAILPDKDSGREREEFMLKLVEKANWNLVPMLNLTDIHIRNGDFDRAIERLEKIHRQFPEFPAETFEYYNKALSSLRKKEGENAIIQFTVLHNYMKVTSPYQAGMMELKGPGGSLIGFPVITFDQQSLARKIEYESLIDIIEFSYVTKNAGLDIIRGFNEGENPGYKYSTHVALADYDGDGDIDIYAGSYDPVSSSYKYYLLNNEMGRFKDVTATSGLSHSGTESSAIFADYDNDGFLDLYILKEGGHVLYRNTGKGTFENVTVRAKTGDKTDGNMALFFDVDHDGDLDLFLARPGLNHLYRNNSDGTFIELAEKMRLSGVDANSCDAAFGDFDDDEDIDLFVVNENAGNVLFSNQRQGVFKDITKESGLESEGGSRAVTAGDYDNDGYLDLFVVSAFSGGHELYRNRRDGTFEKNKNVKEMFSALKNVNVFDAAFIDFDNDGYLDLCIAGESTGDDGRGIFLYHNDGNGNFRDVSHLLPAGAKSGKQIAIMDYNEDGDLDIVIAALNGGIYLLRNDGGNTGHYIKMRLVGLRAGSAKNNFFGIGAKVELRSEDLYQTKVVTDPNIHFGIGKRTKADVIRIRWTNGVPQNLFFPESNQALVEEQMLKGSCPFLYTWNGNEYVFVKDILWRSALGMPLGIMGGTTAYAFADASDDYIKIPGEMLKPVEGIYTIQVTAELWETIYFDQVELVAVDHPDPVDIFIDEQFSPPPFPRLRIYQVPEKHIPLSATDSNGNDLMPYIISKDDIYISDFKPGRYQGITEMKDIILDPGNLDPGKDVFLFLQGWVFPTDASINVAISQSDNIKVIPPLIQVVNKNGEWVAVIDDLGFPMGKDKTVIADLSGRFLSDDHRVRIRTNMEIYWDHIFFSDCNSETPVVLNHLQPVSADLHYRGFSRSYRKGGRYGPHWFDYNVVDTDQKWRDLTGNYTRYGNVLPLLTTSDNKYIIMNAGDEATIKFNAEELPELRRGWKRDFLIKSVGWVKDGDLNTAFGNSVSPLPFHGMSSYPPGNLDIYPDALELEKYHREYNTRKVTVQNYVNAVKGRTR